MAGELALSKKTTGLTLYGVVLGPNRNQRWNGSAFVDTSSITDANWATGLVTFTEDETSDATATVTYTGDWPAITDAGSYMVEVRSGNTPGATLEGVILYTVDAAGVTITDISAAALAKFATEDTSEVSASAGSVAKLSQATANTVNVEIEDRSLEVS